MSFSYPTQYASQHDGDQDQTSQSDILRQTTPSQPTKPSPSSQPAQDHAVIHLFSTQDSYSRLRKAWIHECATPVLLPYPKELVEDTRRWIETRQLEIDSQEASQDLSIRQVEVERVSYIVTDLLRQRLRKLQEAAAFYYKAIAAPDNATLCSREETQFLQGYVKIMGKLLKDSFVGALPRGGWANELLVVDPPTDHCLVTLIAAHTRNLSYSDKNIMVHRGTIVAAEYATFKAYIENGDFEPI